MTVKRFVAPDMRRALDMVREEMGPEAIILSSKRIPQGVEIITSMEVDLPTRGADTRKAFGQRFDEELDSPLESDSAWQVQQSIEQAAEHYNGAGAPQTNPIASKPLLDPKRRAALAKEIEQARERMMAAQNAPQPEPRQEAPVHQTTRPGGSNPVRPQPMELPKAPVQPAPETPEANPQTAPFDLPAFAQPDTAVEGTQYNEWAPTDYAFEDRAPAGLDQQMAGLAAEIKQRVQQHNQNQERYSDERLSELHHQIADMRLLLEQQMWQMRDGQGAGKTLPSLAAETLNRHLKQLGLPESVVAPLLALATPGKHLSVAWREALARVAHQISSPSEDIVNAGGVFALVGPTGVGKTTTIAKLASRYVLEHGLGTVALITTDTYRVGAHDQLRALGRILNVPVRVVDKERPLATVVASLKQYPLVLVDTAGFRQGDPLLKEQEAMLSACPDLKRIVVLSTNSQVQTLKASAHAFAANPVDGCVLTKLDETASLGEAIGVIIAQRLPVLYTTDGQGIPNDIGVASAHHLVAKAVGIMKANDEAPSAPVAKAL